MNRLAGETSPYLLQHRDNPVDWFPWGEEAFARARSLDRPVLLSVGYSSCHWCHVMAHECFEDPGIAELQNRLFVSIKVDREERPDVDRVYMEALQALTGSGGWPMTMFLLPDGRPFFAGTYFPPEERPGLPAFPRLLTALAAAYRERRAEVVEAAGRLSQALLPQALGAGAGLAGLGPCLRAASSELVELADPAYGGFGSAPKFPQCAALEFLLARGVAGEEDSEAAWEVVEGALLGMAEGGILDQLEGGFHRYAVDRRWAVPHFEKMLYDQAQLIRLYLHAWQARGRAWYLGLARTTADFLLRRMELDGGGFAASLDADTEAGEGATYVWREPELVATLGPERAALALDLFGGPGDALVEGGGWVLRGGGSFSDDSQETEPRRRQRERVAGELAARRRGRPAPARDEKVIVGWNGLAIRALAELGVAADDRRYLHAATRAAELIRASAADRSGVGHLVESGRARFVAQLDDLASLGLAALALHEATGQVSWFEWALELGRRAQADYADADGPGWFDTPPGHDPNLGSRPRTLEDGALPSGSSLIAELCLRLFALTGDRSWEERCGAHLSALSEAAARAPISFGALLQVMSAVERGPVELALVLPAHASHRRLLRRARQRYRPELVVGVARYRPGEQGGASGPPLGLGRSLLQGRATAYVCRDFACRRPVSSPDDLDRELGGG